MNALLQSYTLLAANLRTDPQLCLASAVVWLDPLWRDEEDDWHVPHDEDGSLSGALHVTRRVFPDVYVAAVEAIRNGATYAELDQLICGAINQHGIPVDHLEWVIYGIPMPGYGVMLADADFYTSHPDTLPVLDCFGVSPQGDPHTVDVSPRVYVAGQRIAADLARYESKRCRQLSRLIQWLTSCSDNSSVDYSYEEISEFPPLSWTPEDMEFSIAIINEADEIMGDALAGLAFINRQPDVMADLRHNVQHIYNAIEKQKGQLDESRIQLAWSHLTDCPEREAESVT